MNCLIIAIWPGREVAASLLGYYEKNREVIMEQTYVQFEREEQISGRVTVVRV